MSITATNSQELLQALQDAVDGQTIHLGPGEFEGTFPILRSNLTLVGSGEGVTTLRGVLSGAADAQGLLLRDLAYDPRALEIDGAIGDVAMAQEGVPGWSVDRAPLGDLSVAQDPEDAANSVLAFTTLGMGVRDGHKAYQGVKYLPGSGETWGMDLASGLDIAWRFHVGGNFAADGNVQKSGLWLGFQNEAGDLPAGGWYAVLEYVDADGAAALNVQAVDGEVFTGGFRIWLDEGPGGAGAWAAVNSTATGWVDLGIEVAPDAASIQFRVNGEVIHEVDNPAGWGEGGVGISRLDVLTVNSRNDSGVDTTYLYDDIVVRADASGRDVYGEGWTLELGADGWYVTDGVQQVALTGIDRVQVDGTSYALVGRGGYATIQAAIHGAAAGDTVLVSGGLYKENLVLDGKAVNLVAADGAEVTLSPTSGVALTVQGDLGGEAAVLVRGIDFADTTRGVYVLDGTVLGRLHIDDAHFSNIKDWGVRVGEVTYEPGPSTSLGALEITGSVFYDVGGRDSGGNGSAVKLWRFQSDLRIADTEFTGDPDNATVKKEAPANAIELQGVDNENVDVAAPIGTVVLENITIDGGFAKTPVAFYNYADVDGLSIEGLDLTGAVSGWTSLLNFDGIGGDIDASQFGITFPAGALPLTDLQGEKDGSADNAITGTAAGDKIFGKAGNDVLEGGGGNDALFGGAGSDTAVFSGNFADYQIMVNREFGGWTVTDLREGSPDGTDLLVDVEWLQFADGLVDVELLDKAVTWVVDSSGAGDFTTVQQAIAAAQAGDRIEIREGVYAGFVVDKALEIVGDPDVVIEGTFLEDNGIPGGITVDQWLQGAASYDGSSGDGILIAASGVTIKGLAIEGFRNGVRLAGGPDVLEDIVLENLEIANVVTGVANTYGSGSTFTSKVDGIRITGLHVLHAYHGLEIQDPHNRGGLFTGLELEDSTFEYILAKGIYAELLSDSLLTGLDMNEVGQYGRAAPFGGTGLYGNGIDLNLKWGEFSGIVIDGFLFTNVGLSSGGGSPHSGGGAILVKAREDGSYAGDPASYEGALIIRNGSIDGTSTGIRVGEAGVEGLSGIEVVVDNVVVTDHLTSGDFGAFDNRTDDLLTITHGGNAVDTGAASRNVQIEGGDSDDVLTGGRGDDLLVGGAGDDVLAGGDGHDVAVYGSGRADYSVRLEGATAVVTHRNGGAEGTDRITGVETLEFADGSYDLTAAIRVFDADGELVGTYNDLAEALSSTRNGDIVELAAGTHALYIDEGFAAHLTASITLRGANAGISGQGLRGPESVIEITGGALWIHAPDVVIEGLQIHGRIEAGYIAANLEVRNNVIDAAEGIALQLVEASGAVISGNRITGGTGVRVGGYGELEISNNYINAEDSGVVLDAGSAAENARITGNIFNGGQYGVSLQGETDAYADAVAITVTGNTFLAQMQVAVRAEEPLPAGLDGSLGSSLPLNLYGTAPSNQPASSVEVLFSSTQGDLLVGTAVADVLEGGGGDDVIRGGGGDDELTGGAGNDRIYGGAGNDVAIFSGSVDDYQFERRADGAILVSGPDGDDELYGVERVRFGDEIDILVSDLPGIAPITIAVNSADALQGALDALLLEGDTVSIGAAGSGAQGALNGNASIALDQAQGLSLQVADDAGRANVVVTGSGSLSVSTNSSGGVINASGLQGNATLSGGNGNDVLYAGEGNDLLVASHGGGRNVFDGGEGDNTLTLTSAAGGVILDLDAGQLDEGFVQAWADGDTDLLEAAGGRVGQTYGIEYHDSGTDPDSSALLFNISHVTGGAYDDLLIGNDAANIFDGHGGSDDIIGKGGDDVALFRGAPTDYEITRASSGAVEQRNQAIAERLADVGMAHDGFDPDLAVFRVRYIGSDPELAGTDAWVQVETLRFDLGGGQVVDYTVRQVGDFWFLQLPDGGATWQVDEANEDPNLVHGGDGDDLIRGGAGSEMLYGGEGDDTLSGGGGADILDGGEGSDLYEVQPGAPDIEFTSIIDSGSGETDEDVVRLTAGGELDWVNGTISGIERLEYSAAGNTLVLGGDSGLVLEQALIVGGASSEDVLEIAVGAASALTLHVQDVETVIINTSSASGETEVDVGDIGSAKLELTGAMSLVLHDASGGIDASELDGGLTVNALESGTLSLVTGSGNASVHANGDGTAIIDALATTSSLLTLTGDRGFSVSNLNYGIDFAGVTSAIEVVTSTLEKSGVVSFTAGAAHASIHGSLAEDILQIEAADDVRVDIALSGSSAVNLQIDGGTVEGYTYSGSLHLDAADATQAIKVISGFGDDLLEGGSGADELHDGAGSDVVRAGGGDDLIVVHDGDGQDDEDYFFGGAGNDTVCFAHDADAYQIENVSKEFEGQQVRFVKFTHIESGAVDYVARDVEFVRFGDADPVRLPVPPIVLFDHLGNDIGEYDSLAAALYAAGTGYRIEIADGADLSAEGLVSIDVEDLTIAGGASVVLEGLALGEGIIRLRLEGEFSTRVIGNDEDNVLIGNAGDNRLEGGAGNDVIVSGGGNDVLLGGAGNDILVLGGDGGRVLAQGGAGSDKFVFDGTGTEGSLAFNAVINDFRSGQDELDFGHLRGADGEPLTLADLGLAPSPSAHISLDGLLAGDDDVTGTVTLNLVNAMRLPADDFNFSSELATEWQAYLIEVT